MAIALNEWGAYHTARQGALQLDNEYWEIRQFKHCLVNAVKRYQVISKGKPCICVKFVGYHFNEPHKVLNPWLHEPTDLVAFLVEVGVLPPGEPMLQMPN